MKDKYTSINLQLG